MEADDVMKPRNPSILYFVLVKDDEGHVYEWKTENTQKEAELKKVEMEETRGYESYTIEILPVPGWQAAEFIKEIDSKGRNRT